MFHRHPVNWLLYSFVPEKMAEPLVTNRLTSTWWTKQKPLKLSKLTAENDQTLSHLALRKRKRTSNTSFALARRA
jgi:hypothetical protein